MTHNPFTVCGIDGSGNASAISAYSGGLLTRPSDYTLDVISGDQPNDRYERTFFYRDVGLLAASGYQTIWSANNNFSVMTSSGTFTITYNNTTDGLGTTGALSLFIGYIDANKDLQTAFHTLGNTGSDVTSFSGLGINRVVVFSAGSAGVNVNDITLTETTGGGTQSQVPASIGVSQSSLFHFPRLCYPIIKITKLEASRVVGSSPVVNFRFNVYSRVYCTGI